jgi:Ca-activated chloride channel family protein
MLTILPSLGLVLMLLQAAAPRFVVEIISPLAGQPVFGEVSVEAAVTTTEPISRVVFVVDGKPTGEVAQPPYVLRVNVGDDNVEHTFQAIAWTATGKRAEASLASPRVVLGQEVTFELQQLYVTVRAGGERVLDLGEQDFELLDNSVPQQIRSFARGDIPLTAAILLDASTSMRGARLDAAVAGARAFLGNMKPLDEGRLVVFSDHTKRATPFTTVQEILMAGLDDIEAGGGTALNDQLYLALKLLEERQGRRVVVVLSDGVDSHSVMSMNDVAVKARHSLALIYWVRLRDDTSAAPREGRLFSAWRDARWYERELKALHETVTGSGGRIAEVMQLGEIVPAFADILQELRDQYVLGFYPQSKRSDGSWHLVDVKVKRPDLEVITRRGYLDF